MRSPKLQILVFAGKDYWSIMVRLIRYSLVLCLAVSLVLTAACGVRADSSESTFDRLCAIYEQAALDPEETELMKLEGMLARIREELPRFYERHFQHVLKVEPGRVYEVLKELARKEEGREAWRCPAIRDFYEPVDAGNNRNK